MIQVRTATDPKQRHTLVKTATDQSGDKQSKKGECCISNTKINNEILLLSVNATCLARSLNRIFHQMEAWGNPKVVNVKHCLLFTACAKIMDLFGE